MSRLPADCLNGIFEYLEDDKVTLHSCLLVNRLWCEVAVRILWRSIWNMSFNTLIACLPNESKKILHENGIIISAPTSKPPMFNYPAFCKDLSEYPVYCMIIQFFQQSNSPQIFDNYENNVHIVEQEIHKLFMKQISSLKKLSFLGFSDKTFCTHPGAKDCLKNLSELRCRSNTYPEFFYQLSQISHNIQTLIITFQDSISNGLTDLISVQKNLKRLSIVQDDYCNGFAEMIPSLTKLSDTLIKFSFYYGGSVQMPLSFVTKFTNLQKLALTFRYHDNMFEDFKTLQDVTFSQLQVLKLRCTFPRHELFTKFLENNGKNLRELCIDDYCDDSSNLAIAKFCPNLRKLFTEFKNDELETLRIIFNGCKYLESIKIWCGGEFLSEKEILEMIIKYSQNIYELIFCYQDDVESGLLPEELESFLISWTNLLPQKPLSLVIVNSGAISLETNDENMRIIERYIELGIIKFKVTDFDLLD